MLLGVWQQVIRMHMIEADIEIDDELYEQTRNIAGNKISDDELVDMALKEFIRVKHAQQSKG